MAGFGLYLENIAQIMGDVGVSVRITGEGAYINMATNQITIPTELPDSITNESKPSKEDFMMYGDKNVMPYIQRMLLYHELGHFNYTPAKGEDKGVNHLLINSLEDARIENRMGEKWPSLPSRFHNFNRYVLANRSDVHHPVNPRMLMVVGAKDGEDGIFAVVGLRASAIQILGLDSSGDMEGVKYLSEAIKIISLTGYKARYSLVVDLCKITESLIRDELLNCTSGEGGDGESGEEGDGEPDNADGEVIPTNDNGKSGKSGNVGDKNQNNNQNKIPDEILKELDKIVQDMNNDMEALKKELDKYEIDIEDMATNTPNEKTDELINEAYCSILASRLRASLDMRKSRKDYWVEEGGLDVDIGEYLTNPDGKIYIDSGLPIIPNINISILLDVSGSMLNASKLKIAKEATANLSRALELANIQNQIIAYSDDSYMIKNITGQIKNSPVGELRPMGGTDSHLAFKRAMRHINDMDGQPYLLMITDGCDGNGEMDALIADGVPLVVLCIMDEPTFFVREYEKVNGRVHSIIANIRPDNLFDSLLSVVEELARFG